MTRQHTTREDQAGDQQEDRAWAHWDYTPAEWARFDQVDWGRFILKYWLRCGPFILGVVGSPFLFVWSLTLGTRVINGVHVTDGGPFLGSLVIWCLSLTILPFVAVRGSGYFSKPRRRHKARQNPSQERRVTLSGQGLWIAGTFFPFEGPGADPLETSRLLEVRLTAGPTILHFRVKTHRLFSSDIKEIPLLVPAGHEGEAEQLAARYRREVIEPREARERAAERAAKRLQDARVNPPEPR